MQSPTFMKATSFKNRIQVWFVFSSFLLPYFFESSPPAAKFIFIFKHLTWCLCCLLCFVNKKKKKLQRVVRYRLRTQLQQVTVSCSTTCNPGELFPRLAVWQPQTFKDILSECYPTNTKRCRVLNGKENETWFSTFFLTQKYSVYLCWHVFVLMSVSLALEGALVRWKRKGTFSITWNSVWL